MFLKKKYRKVSFKISRRGFIIHPLYIILSPGPGEAVQVFVSRVAASPPPRHQVLLDFPDCLRSRRWDPL